MKRSFILILLLSGSFAAAADHPLKKILAFVNESQITVAIGKYDPKRGWLGQDAFERRTEPGDPFTIYTMAGEVAQVTNIDEHLTYTLQRPVEWTAKISRWYPGTGPRKALAIYGNSPVKAAPARAVPLDDIELTGQVSAYLKKRKLDVQVPILTEAWEVKLAPEDGRSFLVTAHSDLDALRDDEAGVVYAVALILQESKGEWKAHPLAEQTANKPRSQTIAEHLSHYGTRAFYRFVACLDIDENGHNDIVLHTQITEGTQLDVFTYNGRKPRNVITIYKPSYN